MLKMTSEYNIFLRICYNIQGYAYLPITHTDQHDYKMENLTVHFSILLTLACQSVDKVGKYNFPIKIRPSTNKTIR